MRTRTRSGRRGNKLLLSLEDREVVYWRTGKWDTETQILQI